MEQARTTLRDARTSAQHHNYQQLMLALMQTLQPWGVTTDVRPLPLTRTDVEVFENFWRVLFDKRAKNSHGFETLFSMVKGWAILVCAVVHAGDMGKDFAAVASQKCGDVAKAIDTVLLELERQTQPLNVQPPQSATVIILGGAYCQNAPIAPPERPHVFSRPHLVKPPQK